jgi:hypothetical protein
MSGTKAYSGCTKTEYAKTNTGTRHCAELVGLGNVSGTKASTRVASTGRAKNRDQQKQLHAISERRLAGKASTTVARRTTAKGVVVVRGCRSRRAGVVEEGAMTLVMKSCWTKMEKAMNQRRPRVVMMDA